MKASISAGHTHQESSSRYDMSLDMSYGTLLHGLYPAYFPEQFSYRRIKTRVPNAVPKTQQTISHLVKAVATLERWLWATKKEGRPIEEIEPQLLDEYLSSFFPILKKPSGKDYEAESLSKFRSYLNRFLKETGYPYCICNSFRFSKSQKTFSAHRRILAQLSVNKGQVDISNYSGAI